jgi:hypothetical protein
MDRFGRPLLFAPLDAAEPSHEPARLACLEGWCEATTSNGRPIARRAPGASLRGVVVPISAEQLRSADRAMAEAGVTRAIATVDVEGTRRWAYLYTRG